MSLFIDINLKLLHAARSPLFHTWQIFESLYCLFGTQVDDEQMWRRGILLGLPVGRLLKVERLIAGMVALKIFRVGILHVPLVARESFAVIALCVQLGNSYGLAVVSVQTFYCEIASRGSAVEVDGLPSVAALHHALCYWCG